MHILLYILKFGVMFLVKERLSYHNIAVECKILAATQQSSIEDAEIVSFLSDAILQEFKEKPQNFLIKYKGATVASHNRLADIVDELAKHIEGVTMHMGYNSVGKRKYRLVSRLWFVDSMEAFLKLNERRTLNYYPVNYLIVYLPKINDNDDDDEHVNLRIFLNQLFDYAYNEYLMNVNVFTFVRIDAKISIYTYFPYQTRSCKSTDPHLLHEYAIGRTTMPKFSELFPPLKYENLNGCNLTLALENIPPYTSVEVHKNDTKSLSGSEGEILKLIANKMNFSIVIITSEFDVSGTVFDNGTATGAYKLLLDKRANLSFGGYSCLETRMSLLTATQPYFQSSIFVVLKSGEPYSPIEVLFYPFSTNTWLLLLLVCSMRFLWIKLMWRFLQRLPRSFQQFMLAMWLITVMYFRSGYEGKFINYMQIRPLKPRPQTYDEMQDENYLFIADFVTINVFKFWESVPDNIHIVNHTNAEESFNLLLKSGRKFGLFTKKEFFSLYLKDNLGKRQQFLMQKDNIISDLLCMYLPTQSYLVDMFNELILRLRSSGIVTKFSNKFTEINENTNDDQYQMAHNRFRPLNLVNFQGVFFLFLSGWLFCIIVFIIENLKFKYNNLNCCKTKCKLNFRKKKKKLTKS